MLNWTFDQNAIEIVFGAAPGCEDIGVNGKWISQHRGVALSLVLTTWWDDSHEMPGRVIAMLEMKPAEPDADTCSRKLKRSEFRQLAFVRTQLVPLWLVDEAKAWAEDFILTDVERLVRDSADQSFRHLRGD